MIKDVLILLIRRCRLLPYFTCQHKLWVQWFTLWYTLYFLRSKHIICTWLQVLITEPRLVTMSTSLCTQTGLHNLTIQVLNTRVWYLDIWYTSLTSVHYILEHGLPIVTESFSTLNLIYTTTFVKVQIRSDMPSHAIPDTVYLPCALNWFALVKI